VGSFMIMVVANVYFIKSNPTPIINHHYSTVEVIELYWFSVNWNFPCFELE